MTTDAILSSAPTTAVAAGLRSRITPITALLGRFPLAIHQLLSRLALF